MLLLFTGNKMESFIFVSVPFKLVFWHFEFIFLPKNNGHFQTQLLNFIQTAKTPLVLGLRQKWMIPSCSPWKVVTFFGKDHVNWSNINGVMIGRSWKIKFGKFKIGVTKKIIDFSKLNCSTSSYHISTNTGPIYMFCTKKCNYFSRATRRNHSFLS